MILRDTVFAAVTAVALLVVCAASFGCGNSADPVRSGRLCVPAESGCPSESFIERSSPGSNILDLAIRNTGPTATIRFDVTLEEGRVALDAAESNDVGIERPGQNVFPARYQLESGASTNDRFVPADLTKRKQLNLRLTCQPCPECTEDCEVAVDFVWLTERIECENDDDCRGDRVCNETTGECVECDQDDDCRADQNCHLPSGRCLPPVTSSCGHVPGQPTSALPMALLVFGLLALRIFRDRRAADAFCGVCLLLACAAVITVPEEAEARPPSSTLEAAIGPRFIAGDLGHEAQRGIGVELREILRWRYGGAAVWIETNYFVTTQEPPPLSKELQIFGFGVGPRLFVPIGNFEIFAGGGYQRVGFSPNSLVGQTGSDANFHSMGASAGAGYHFSSFVARVDGQFYPMFEANGSLLSFNLSFGISTR